MDFITHLLRKQKRKEGKPLRQNRAGTLRRGIRNTPLELQKRSLSWRSE